MFKFHPVAPVIPLLIAQLCALPCVLHAGRSDHLSGLLQHAQALATEHHPGGSSLQEAHSLDINGAFFLWSFSL